MEILRELSHPELLYRFAIALVIGFLIGLQREYAGRREGEMQTLFGGVRTFSLLGLLGCASAFLGSITQSSWPQIIVLTSIGLIISISYFHSYKSGNTGITTEIAAIMTVIIGILSFHGEMVIAAILGVAMTVLLALKVKTRALTENISSEDIYATLQFAVISVIILPILPGESVFGPPFDVLIPQRIWLMVVFISGISFLGYILIKIVGPKKGLGLTGILGGLASSTAVTLSFSQKSKEARSLSNGFAFAILIAWCIMFIRVIIEVAAINKALLGYVIFPLVAGLVACFGWAAWLYYRKSDDKRDTEAQFKNPFRLGPAIVFGLIYATILLFSKIAQQELGSTGVYLSSIVSAVVDVDAITLSMSELSKQSGSISKDVASNAIVIAAVTNTFVKGGIVFITGSAGLRRAILPGLIITAVTAIAIAFIF